MAKTTGIVRYMCDRCGKTEYLPGGGQSASWYPVSRFDSNSVQSNLLFCQPCYADYQKLAAAVDKEFSAFLKNAGASADKTQEA